MRNSSESLKLAALYSRLERMSMKFLFGCELELSFVYVDLLAQEEDDAHRIGAAID